jgi:hypothetical protein
VREKVRLKGLAFLFWYVEHVRLTPTILRRKEWREECGYHLQQRRQEYRILYPKESSVCMHIVPYH